MATRTLTRLLTVEDVAAHYQKPASWVRRMRREGHLQAVNVGTDRRPEWRFTEAQLADFDRTRTR